MSEESSVVFIVDDDETVRCGLGRLLRSAGIRSEEFASAAEFLARPAFDGVACIILDISMPGLTGVDLQQRLLAGGVDYPVIFLTGHGDLPTGVQAMKRGAIDFLTKPVDEEVLLEAVAGALEKHEKLWQKRQAVSAVRKQLESLSPREIDVLRCLITGATNKRIAAHLGVVEDTVKVHRGRILHKAGVTSVAALVRLCAITGIKPAAMTLDLPGHSS